MKRNWIKHLTAREAANYLRVSVRTLYRLEHSGKLIPLRTPGRHRLYTLRMLNDCLGIQQLENK